MAREGWCLTFSAPPLGFSNVTLFHRPAEQADRFQRNYRNVPIAQKKSYKRIQVSNAFKVTLEQAARVTFIRDREGDIYEQFACIPDDKYHLLIRSRVTRRLVDGSDLYHSLESLPPAGYYSLEVQSDKRKNKEKRIVQMAICHGRFRIARPANLAKAGYTEHIMLNCIWAQEITPGVSEPINWKLLTTHEVCCYEDAAKMVEWYSYRWYIHHHADRSIDRNQVMRLADCTFIDRNEKLLITGSTGINKKNVMRFFVLSLTTDYKTEYYDFVIFILCVYL